VRRIVSMHSLSDSYTRPMESRHKALIEFQCITEVNVTHARYFYAEQRGNNFLFIILIAFGLYVNLYLRYWCLYCYNDRRHIFRIIINIFHLVLKRCWYTAGPCLNSSILNTFLIYNVKEKILSACLHFNIYSVYTNEY